MGDLRDKAFHLLTSSRATLAVLGAASIMTGVFYLPAVAAIDRIIAAEQFLPLGWWAALWFAVGVVVLASAVSGRRMSDAVGVQIGLLAGWSLMYLLSWFAGWTDRGYTIALVYGLLCYVTVSYFARVDFQGDDADG